MAKEVVKVCTGSYTGAYCPKWSGPWAQFFNAKGEYLPLDTQGDTRIQESDARLARRLELRAANRLPLGW